MIPSVKQQQIHECSYLFTAVCPETGSTCSLIMPVANTQTMDVFLQALFAQQENERIILCMDKAGWHRTKKLQIPKNRIVRYLPPYSLEINPVELIWRGLRSKYFNNKTFDTLEKVEDHMEFAITDYVKNKENMKSLTKYSISS